MDARLIPPKEITALEPPALSVQLELQRKAIEEIVQEDVEILSEQNPSKPICKTIYDYGCSCMTGLQRLGYPIKGNNAENLQSNVPEDYEPKRGDIILFKYPKNHHAASVIWVFPSGNIQIWECNYRPGVCRERLVLKNDKAIRGYIHNKNFAKILNGSKL